MRNAINLIGEKFGKLTVLERDESKIYKNGKYRAIWICKCDCGKITSVRSFSLRKGITQSCGCIASQKMRGPKSSNFKGVGEIPATFFWKLKTREKLNRISLNVSIEDIWNLFLKQNKRCSLTNRELKFGGYKKETTASLDRIDSSKGYIIDNVQWLHKDVNMMKQSFTQENFIKLCNEVANLHKCDIINS